MRFSITIAYVTGFDSEQLKDKIHAKDNESDRHGEHDGDHEEGSAGEELGRG